MSSIGETIRNQIDENPIILYMKGTPDQPLCGFSASAVRSLAECGEKYAYVNILDNPEIRTELPKIAKWPTFPQLWINGELIGGSDILEEMVQTGELTSMVNAATSPSA